MLNILKGSPVADAIYAGLTAKIKDLKECGIVPALSIIRVGNQADQIAYVQSAGKRCSAAGIAVRDVALAEDADEKTVVTAIYKQNDDENIHGVLIMRPLPKHISDKKIRAALSSQKDVDGITDASLTGLFSEADNGFIPCTAKACMEIINYYGINCEGKNAVVIGRSLVVGKPVAILLMNANATVTVCHTKTADIPAHTRNADIIIAAAGQPSMLTSQYLSPGQTVIDVGLNWDEKERKLCGDVSFSDAEQVVAAITPVPGGVGIVTTAVLLSNVVKAAKNAAII